MDCRHRGPVVLESLRGLTVYKMSVMGVEGLLVSLAILALPLIILFVLTKIMPPWDKARHTFSQESSQ